VATSGPYQSDSVAEFDDGWTPWANVPNAVTDDNSYATCNVNSAENAFTNFLDFLIPADAFAEVAAADAITDVQIEVACKTSAAACKLSFAQLIKAGSVDGDPVAPNANVGTSEGYVSHPDTVGVSGWSISLNGSDVNAGTFGVRIQFFAESGGAMTVSVDALRITLTGTFTGGAGGGNRRRRLIIGRAA
jgi:hypothetical protein